MVQSLSDVPTGFASPSGSGGRGGAALGLASPASFLQSMGIDGISEPQVSEMARIDASDEAFRSRPPSMPGPGPPAYTATYDELRRAEIRSSTTAAITHVVLRGVTREKYDAVRAAADWLNKAPGGVSPISPGGRAMTAIHEPMGERGGLRCPRRATARIADGRGRGFRNHGPHSSRRPPKVPVMVIVPTSRVICPCCFPLPAARLRSSGFRQVLGPPAANRRAEALMSRDGRRGRIGESWAMPAMISSR